MSNSEVVYPSRDGVEWSEREIVQLEYEVYNGFSSVQIADSHQRSLLYIEWAIAQLPLLVINGRNYGAMLHAVRTRILINIEIMANLPLQ